MKGEMIRTDHSVENLTEDIGQHIEAFLDALYSVATVTRATNGLDIITSAKPLHTDTFLCLSL